MARRWGKRSLSISVALTTIREQAFGRTARQITSRPPEQAPGIRCDRAPLPRRNSPGQLENSFSWPFVIIAYVTRDTNA